MKNRIASLILVFALLMSLCSSAVARDNRITVQSGGAERFTDVPTSHWAYGYINKVVGSGLFNGMTATTFAPSNAMTRAQFVIVMSRMEGLEVERVETQTKFPDVPSTYWAAGAIQWATEAGIVGGFGDGTFKPSSPITRGQFAALIHRYIVSKRYVNLHVVDPEPAPFTDAASVSTAFTNDVEYARIHGLLTGYSDGTVRAGNAITRAAIAAILARFLDLVTESGYTPLLDGPVIDGGDTGDTDSPPIEAPTSYDDIKVKINNPSHGSAPVVSVTRNGAVVAADDLQQGDRVTVTYKPDSGYSATVRVKDKNNKTVSVNRIDANSSWFYMPSAMPVTITVTYSRDGGGSTGGGGGNSSSGGGGSGDYGTNYYYYLNASASATPAEGGFAYLSNTAPTAQMTTLPDALTTLQFTRTSASVVGYVWFFINDGYELNGDPVITTTTGAVASATPAQLGAQQTLRDETGALVKPGGKTVVYYTISGTGKTVNPDSVAITATFKTTGGGQGPDVPPAGKVNWTLKANVTGGFAAIAEENNFPAKITANSSSVTMPIQVDRGQSKTLYVAFSADSDFLANTLKVTNDGSVTLTPVTASTTADRAVYQVTFAAPAEAANSATSFTSLLTAVFDLDPAKQVGHTNNVNILEPQLFENNAVRALAEAEKALVPVPTTEDSPAAATSTVTVKTPYTAGAGVGYHVYSVTVKGVTSGDEYTATLSKQAESPDLYTFTMPDEDVNVQVVYALNDDNDLTYKVNVTVEGQGSMTLNVNGTDYPISNESHDPIEITLKESEYATLYSESVNQAIPAYVVSTPIAATGWRYDSLDGVRVGQDRATNINPGETLNVTVTFVQEKSYGYNLTIIGQGTVKVKLTGVDEAAYTNSTSEPLTVSSGSVILDSSAVSLRVTEVTPGADYEFDTAADNVQIANADAKVGVNVTISEGMTDIVVAMREKDAVPVAFTVKAVQGGSVTVKAEGGKIVSGAMPSEADAKAALSSSSAQSSYPLTGSGATMASAASQNYYAYSGTVITLVPAASGNYKTKSVQVTDSGAALADQLASNGFSFTLKKGGNPQAAVEFDTFKEYQVRFQAPYNVSGTVNTFDLHSKSTTISADKTLKQILYSLNDGQSTGATTGTQNKNRITNNIAVTPKNLNTAIFTYLTETQTENKTTYLHLQDELNKRVQAQLENNLQLIIDKQKNDMVTGEAIQTEIQNSLHTALSSAGSMSTAGAAVTGESKASVIQQILDQNADLKAAFENGYLTADNFSITATVTPILTLDYESVSSDAKDKSVEKQLRSFIMDHLLNRITVNAPNPAPTANVNLAVSDENGVTLTISATANFPAEPELDTSVSFADYQDQLSIWASAITEIRIINADSNAAAAAFNSRPAEQRSQTSVFPLSKFEGAGVNTNNVKTTIASQLAQVDTAIEGKWSSAIGSIIQNGVMNVSMGNVLTKDMLDNVVEGNQSEGVTGLLDNVIDKLVTKVASVGNGDATRSAFMNIYRDFVVFNDGEPSKLITLKNQKGDSIDNPPLGKIDGNNLVITLDFESLIRDTRAFDDNTAFEKLMDLLLALRDGLSTDIRDNSTQTAQSVFSGMIKGQLNLRGQLIANKWGATIRNFEPENDDGGRVMTDMERKEVSDLLAELMMSSVDSDIESVWQKFEAKGYRSVAFSVNIDAETRDSLQQIVTGLSSVFGSGYGTSFRAGFDVTQKLTND